LSATWGSRPLDAIYEHTEMVGECLLWLGLREDGYGKVRVTDSLPPRHEYAHRLAWKAAGREIPDGWDVRHVCGNRSCVRVEHLDAAPGEDGWALGWRRANHLFAWGLRPTRRRRAA
jgi:HNH endonuclease